MLVTLIIFFILLALALILALTPFKKDNFTKIEKVEKLDLQKLWMDHVSFTREFIIGDIYSLPFHQETTDRLLQNQIDLANAFNKLYPGSFEIVKNLLTEHIMIAANLVNEMINLEEDQALQTNEKWKENAIDIGKALATLNSKYDKTVLADAMLKHLETTNQELVALLNGQSGIQEYDVAVNHMLMLNDYLFA